MPFYCTKSHMQKILTYQKSVPYNSHTNVALRRRSTVVKDSEEIFLKPIQRGELLVNQVYKYVRDSILTGKYTAGEKIIETRLAAELQVSRSPVREAIRLLTTEQLLHEQDGSIVVFQPSIEDFYELYELRLALEPVLVRKAADRVTVKQLAVLEHNLSEMEICIEARSMEQMLYLNTAFHQSIWEISESSRFMPILQNASALIHYYCLLVLNINNRQTNILSEHTAVYQALKEGCPAKAEQAMYSHIMKDLEVVKTQTQAYAQ